jgi:hypothetical protein
LARTFIELANATKKAAMLANSRLI